MPSACNLHSLSAQLLLIPFAYPIAYGWMYIAPADNQRNKLSESTSS
jgi:hypothetical protein